MKITNWKTTICGILAGLPQALPLVGFPIDPAVANFITGLGVLLGFIFAKDLNVTGGTKQQ